MADKQNDFSIGPITQGYFPLRIVVAGESGDGKTFSAIRLAVGLANGVHNDVIMIDTDNSRGRLYANMYAEGKIRYIPFEPPHSPKRFKDAIAFAEDQGAKVIIIDCVTDESEYLALMAEDDRGSWLRPKKAHKAYFMHSVNTSPCHIVSTVLSQQVSIPDTEMKKTKLKAPDKYFEDKQWDCEKRFMRHATLGILVEHRGEQIRIFKTAEPIEAVVKGMTAPITEEHGRLLFRWVSSLGKPDGEVEKFRARFRQITENGLEAVESAITKTPQPIQDKLGHAFFGEIRAAAIEYDRLRSEIKGGNKNEEI